MHLIRIAAKSPHYIDPTEIVHVCATDDGRQRETAVYLKNGHSLLVGMAVEDFIREAFGSASGGNSSMV
ncbi:MAG: hypothetical protein AB8G99_11135 [Planctomycetaceae bacterium]